MPWSHLLHYFSTESVLLLIWFPTWHRDGCWEKGLSLWCFPARFESLLQTLGCSPVWIQKNMLNHWQVWCSLFLSHSKGLFLLNLERKTFLFPVACYRILSTHVRRLIFQHFKTVNYVWKYRMQLRWILQSLLLLLVTVSGNCHHPWHKKQHGSPVSEVVYQLPSCQEKFNI